MCKIAVYKIGIIVAQLTCLLELQLYTFNVFPNMYL